MNKESLDLYAKIEPLIGFYDDYERLYDIYLKTILGLKPKRILDFGCGNGRLLEILKNSGFEAVGVDLSPEMVKRASRRGVKAICGNINELNEEFDLIIAASDVLNYFDDLRLEEILFAVSNKLSQKGFFVADINTLYGFEHIAEGTLIKENESLFLAIEANFEDKKLMTNFTLFERSGDLYKKESQTIAQYFHSFERFKKIKYLTLKEAKNIFLFDAEYSDKILMIFQKNS
jgi:SAM-dependent methyltransferase